MMDQLADGVPTRGASIRGESRPVLQLSSVNQMTSDTAAATLSPEASEVCAILLEAITAMRASTKPGITTTRVNSLFDAKILSLVAARRNATPQQMAEGLQASRSRVQQSLLHLVTSGQLIGTGRTRGRSYHLPTTEEAAVA